MLVKRRKAVLPVKVTCENFDCRKPFSKSFTVSDFEEWVQLGEHDCPRCGEELSVEGIRLECHVCEAEIDFDRLSMIPLLLDDVCASCAGRFDADLSTIRIAGSWNYEASVNEWVANGRSAINLERPGRSDYWEGLVHFCNAEEFISIYRDGRIIAASTGLYGKRNPSQTKAVCLTEATRPNWDELKETHGDYGFVFRKSDVIRQLNGGPVLYVTQEMIDRMKRLGEEFPPSVWPLLTKVKLPTPSSQGKIDYLHEREWRVPGDIDFAKLKPYAVTIPNSRPGIVDEELILMAAREFEELSE